MRREVLVLAVCITMLTVGCSRLERLSIIRPTAERGDFTQVTPVPDVSDKRRKQVPSSAAALLASATEYYRAGQMDLAARDGRQALKVDPRSGDAHSLLAAVDAARGDAASAGEHYRQAVSLSPSTGAYANNYGTWLCGNGRALESLDWFDKAITDPAYSTKDAAFANKGACARKAGQAALAEMAWRQALALQPVSTPALAGMAQLNFDAGRYMDARAFAERWLAIAPNDAEGLRLASQIEQKLGDSAAASRYLHRLQTSSPGPQTTPRPR